MSFCKMEAFGWTWNCYCSFKNLRWNPFAAGIPERVWSPLGCFGAGQKQATAFQQPHPTIHVSVFPHPSLSPVQLSVFSLSPGGSLTDVTVSKPGATSVTSSLQKTPQKTGLTLAQHPIKRAETRAVILSISEFVGKELIRGVIVWGSFLNFWSVTVVTVLLQTNIYTTTFTILRQQTAASSKWC